MDEVAPTRKARLRSNSQARRKRGKLELHHTIVRAAVTLFEQQGGVEHFSLRQVAEAIGYSPATIHLHFQDKEALLFHVTLEGVWGSLRFTESHVKHESRPS